MINKLLTISALSCFMAVSCFADSSSINGCEDCEQKEAFFLASDNSHSNQRCPCEGNESAKSDLASSGSSSFSESSASSVSSSDIQVV